MTDGSAINPFTGDLTLARPRTGAELEEEARLRVEARGTVVHYARSIAERHRIYAMLGFDAPRPAPREPGPRVAPLLRDRRARRTRGRAS